MEKGKGAKIIGGNGVRIDNDFYPTPREVTVALMNFLNLPPCTVWEPACGELAMSNVIKEYGHNVISTDLVTGDSFFSTSRKADAIITNPPFKLAELFIKKSLQDAPVVAMLLKTQYWHAAKRAKLFVLHPPAFILALTWRPNFFGDKTTGSPTMDFIWTVWKDGETDTRYRLLNNTNNVQRNQIN